MKKSILTFVLFLVVLGISYAQPLLEILKVPAGAEPSIDGVMGDKEPWSEEAWIPMDALVPESTTDGMSCRFQILHNDEFIFIMLQVFDETPNNDPAKTPNTWERDNIEIFFHMDDAVASSAYVEGVTCQLRFQRNGDGVEGIDGTGLVVDRLKADPGFEWMIEGDESSFIFEAAFPISVINNNGSGPFNGTDFFFDLKYADNTTGAGSGGRTQQNYWSNSNDAKWNDATLLSAVALIQTEVKVKNSVSNLIKSNSSVSVVNNSLKTKNVEGVVRIYNTSGKMVHKAIIERNGSIDISNLISGAYIFSAKGVSTKFIK